MGDVKRRRGRQRQAPDRHYLGAVALVALSAWSIWVTVLFSLEPARLLTYLAFFVPLGIALASTAALGAYILEWKQGRQPSLRMAARRGSLVAVLLIANLAFQAAHRWSLIVGVVSVLFLLGAEASGLRRAA
jgi:hypothetical protein